MPAPVAALLTALGVVALIVRDSRRNPGLSPALWIPTLWIVICGSRFVSQWMNLHATGVSDEYEGSTVDALYFGMLILLGAVVLVRRHVTAGEFVQANVWIALFLAYGLLSIGWSDYPFVAFKRWTKALGHPVMALLILTDPDPARALRIVLRRCGYVLLPGSVLLIKYFPEYAKYYDAFGGKQHFNGVALTKNGLALGCMLFGLFFVSELFQRPPRGGSRFGERLVAAVMLATVVWLLRKANSATSAATLAVGAVLMVLLYNRILRGEALSPLIVLAVPAVLAAHAAFDLSATVLGILGRDPTLTDRTLLWRDILALQENPLLGAGYESFWLGSRLEVLWAKWWWGPNQSHNGYIETYVNLGYVGLFLLVAAILSAYARVRRAFLEGSEVAPLLLALLAAIVLFNFTESSFKGVHVLWTVFYIVALDYPLVSNPVQDDAAEDAAEVDPGDARPGWQQ